MRFHLVDRVVEWAPGSHIVAIKNLTMAEEYLAEHFPTFPVMPGVLMLEAITQAGGWLIRATRDFVEPVVLLQEAKTVKYGQFIAPGRQLVLRCYWLEDSERLTTIKATGRIGDKTSVSAKVVLRRFSLADEVGADPAVDERLRGRLREHFDLLTMPGSRSTLATA